jgi:hypothetical protein
MKKFHTLIITCKYHTRSSYIAPKGYLGHHLTFCRYASIYEFLKYGEKECRASRRFCHTADIPVYILVSDSNSNNRDSHGCPQILERILKYLITLGNESLRI